MPHSIRLHRYALSGHSHRVQLMLSLLQRPCELVDVDMAAGEQRTPSFLARNAFGQVPVVEDGALTLADSNAILVYLALTHDSKRCWLPVGAAEQAQVQRWLSVAAGPLAQGPAAARVAALFGRTWNPQWRVIARELFGVMHRHLEQHDWSSVSPHQDWVSILHRPSVPVYVGSQGRLRSP